MERAEQAAGRRKNAALEGDGQYRLLVDRITDYAIYMLDPDGYVISWNAGAERFKGYTEEEILGEHFSRFYPEEDRKAGLPQRALATAAAEGRFETEGWRIRKDGSRFWAHVILDPIHTPDGTHVGFAKITRDLTERKQVEAELKRSEQHFRLLVQGVTDYAIYMLDPEGRVTSWNVGAERIKGYKPEEIIGQHFSRFYTEEDRLAGQPQRGIETARREDRFENEGWRVRKDGSRFWASIVIDAIRADTGEVIGFAKVTRDISEKMKAQRALERAREELFQAQKMEAIGQLTGGIAHDFNNLLMVVLGSLEIARKRVGADQRVIPLIDNAIQGAQRGAALTQRMLAFSRRQQLHLQPIDIPALIDGMMGLLQRSLGPSIFLETDLPASLPKISSDANQLETAILNLVVNARDSMPGGGVILITARESAMPDEDIAPADPTARHVCLAIVDRGEGMDPETLAAAATPFFTTKGIGKGTGLGLSMVQGLTEQSGGRLILKSSRQEGTAAEMWFPVIEAARLAELQEQPVPVEPVQAGKRSLTILAVDDDGLVLMNTALMLQDLGHQVLEANSGAEALALLRRRKVDLVISDHAMPRMTGSELAVAIRAEWPDMPMILATGYADLPTPRGDQTLPRLAKPFSQVQLCNAILKAVV
jgi:PAS domain S-box-containing protein